MLDCLGPNQKIALDVGLFSDREESRCFIEFRFDWFGEKRTLDVRYGGDEKFFDFIDKNISKIYKISYSTTINPFFGKKVRLMNVADKFIQIIFHTPLFDY
jgi:hypothetical protein